MKCRLESLAFLATAFLLSAALFLACSLHPGIPDLLFSAMTILGFICLFPGLLAIYLMFDLFMTTKERKNRARNQATGQAPR